MSERLPAQSVDVSAPSARELHDPEHGRHRARLVFLAAFVFAALAWIGTLVTATVSSETNGIYASWIAIFPTTFGAAGLFAIKNGKGPARAFLGAFAAGVLGVIALWFFFEGIWPSL
jgi:hypothetical protein